MAAAVNNNAENEMKLEEDSGAAKNTEMITDINKQKEMMKKKRSVFRVPVFGCLRLDAESPTIDKKNEDGSVDMVSADADGFPTSSSPSHLIVMVNGIIGSAEDWRYAAKQFLKAYPEDVIVHCSERNTSTLTFDGIDVMGERLADEVILVIQRYPHLHKISFIGHSLGGLIARYAIALLHGSNYLSRLSRVDGKTGSNGSQEVAHEQIATSTIAGLEPMNFITVATPHLGSRGHNQVPLFCGFRILETVARQTCWFLGRTGRHLFLTDHDDGKPPLLLRMVNDYEGLPFISALHSFKHRVAYANMRFDQIVGWCTSSLRREAELPKWRHVSRNEKYRHIVNVETVVAHAPQQVYTLESSMDGWRKLRTQELMEAMIMQLRKLGWERVDVKFRGGKHRFLAHSSIQVQTYCIHSSGADVIQHMIDNFVL